jgi:hypothetical protein
MPQSATEVSFLDLPYRQRKFITVTDGPSLTFKQFLQKPWSWFGASAVSLGSLWLGITPGAAGLTATLTSVAGALGAGSVAAGSAGLTSAASALGAGSLAVGAAGPIIVALAPIALLGSAGLGAMVGIAVLIRNANQDASILAVHPRETSRISFPIGHPLDHVVYVGHPGIPTKYYPAATFHRALFEDKLSEIVNILIDLGAKTFFAEHISGWSTEFVTRVSAILPMAVTSAEPAITGGTNSKSNSRVSVSAELQGSSTPKLPSDLV